MHDLAAVRATVFDSLEEQIALIDQAGVIVDTNTAWKNFGAENGLSGNSASVGSNYLDTVRNSCNAGDSLAGDAAQGILSVINRELPGFYHEYPCHSPTEQRWFMMRVVALGADTSSLFVISHLNITQRKLAEVRAEYLSLHDPLTGLANLRKFNEFLNQEMRRNVRDGSTLSLLMIDLDHFKEYNDKFGHPAGDQCLIKVGEFLQSVSRRPGDLAVRLGGDEFALILGSTGTDEAHQVAEEVRMAIKSLKLIIEGKTQITASIGIATASPKEPDLDSLLRSEADKALYMAKTTGRNAIAHSPVHLRFESNVM